MSAALLQQPLSFTEKNWKGHVSFFKSIINIYLHYKIYMYIIGMYNAYAV